MQILDKINSAVWGSATVFILLFTGILYTFRLRLIQLKLPIFLAKQKKTNNKGLSQFKTVCMSLGTAMGTGNITGVAAALALGGAGAVFWMWVSAFLGMALVCGENILSVRFSGKDCRGPMAYLEKGLGCRKLALFFAFMCMLVSFGMGGMVQVSAFSDSLRSCCDISPVFICIAAFLLISTVILGGAERIGSAAQLLLPAVTALFVIGCFAVIFTHIRFVPRAFASIFTEAFGFRQAAGGISGTALAVGIRRGIFSNEAGLGSSPLLHSAAESDSPETQGMWSMFEVFFDTVICCTLTAVTILCSAEDMSMNTAFSSVFGNGSAYVIAAEMAVFAFCTIIGWYYCGETAFAYFSSKGNKRLFALAFAVFASFGAVIPVHAVWTLSDIFNALMAFPNLLALLLLNKKAVVHCKRQPIVRKR